MPVDKDNFQVPEVALYSARCKDPITIMRHKTERIKLFCDLFLFKPLDCSQYRS